MHLGVNHLGHFALTALLRGALTARPGARVVSISSDIADRANIDFDDLQSQRSYGFIEAYGQSKLANLLFALELNRRGIASYAANPGIAHSDIFRGRETDWGQRAGLAERAVRLAQMLLGQPPAIGARATLYQATDDRVLNAAPTSA